MLFWSNLLEVLVGKKSFYLIRPVIFKKESRYLIIELSLDQVIINKKLHLAINPEKLPLGKNVWLLEVRV
jgi:hypothetical protein